MRQLGAKLDRLVAKADETGTEVKADYREQLGHIREMHTTVRGKIDSFKTGKGQKWENFRSGVKTAWQDLESAFKALT